MSEPLVCAVMLTKDRPEMAARAVRSFRAQTYQSKRMVILDSGKFTEHSQFSDFGIDAGVIVHGAEGRNTSIGILRNEANGFADGEIIIHWDDDDVSHPNRIAEQVAFLQVFDADVVGYDELLFWRRVDCPSSECEGGPAGLLVHEGSAIKVCSKCDGRTFTNQAWRYKATGQSKPPGTSLCYWRKTWERKPFPNLSTGEDSQWQRGLDVETRSSIADGEPRLIASIHGGNTAPYDIETQIERGAHLNWKRVPAWDKFCSERMSL